MRRLLLAFGIAVLFTALVLPSVTVAGKPGGGGGVTLSMTAKCAVTVKATPPASYADQVWAAEVALFKDGDFFYGYYVMALAKNGTYSWSNWAGTKGTVAHNWTAVVYYRDALGGQGSLGSATSNVVSVRCE
jgi:hypothetical protein